MPEDIGLVCFDDIEHLAVLSPFLTVVDQPADVRQPGRAASVRAHRRQGRRSRRIVLQADPIVRESCCADTGVPRRPT